MSCKIHRSHHCWRDFGFTYTLNIYYILLNTASLYTTKSGRQQVAREGGNLFRANACVPSIPSSLLNYHLKSFSNHADTTARPRLSNFIQKYTTIHIQKKKKNPETVTRRGYRSSFSSQWSMSLNTACKRFANCLLRLSPMLIFEIQIKSQQTFDL